MKKVLIIAVLFGFIVTLPISVKAENMTDTYSEQIENIENSLPEYAKERLEESGISADSIYNNDFDFSKMFEILKSAFLDNISDVSNLLISLLLLMIISIIVQIIIEDKMTNYILLLFSAVLILPEIINVIGKVSSALESGYVFMSALIPVYAGLIISSGQPSTGAGYSTVMFVYAQIVEIVSSYLIVPITGCLLALSISSSLIDNKLKNAVHFISKTITSIISITFMIFLSLLSLQTVITKASDSIGLKTAKYFSGSFIPIAGSFLSESLSVVITGIGMMKSSIGVFSIISLVVIFLPVLIELLAVKLMFGFFGYMFEAFDLTAVVGFLKSLNGVLQIVLAVIISCIVIFIISTALTMGVS